MKLSTGKALFAGRQQIFRTFADGIATHDVIACFDEDLPGTALLKPVMLGGRRTASVPHWMSRGRAAERVSISCRRRYLAYKLPRSLMMSNRAPACRHWRPNVERK